MEEIKVIPLGGLGRIGANMTAIEYKESIIVVDAGAAFTDDDSFGNVIIPDTTYLRENVNKIKGIVITHGHEDHIGALPYIVNDINAPIYATRFTIGMVYNKLCDFSLAEKVSKRIVGYNAPITIGDFEIEFIKVNHSVAEAAALAIKCDAGTIIHTGDFKIDYTPLSGATTDIARLAQLGTEGVLALMCDSTNAEKEGTTPSERMAVENIEKIFEGNPKKRIILSVFASNIDRIYQIIKTSIRHNRKVCIEGKSLSNVIKIAQRLNYIEDISQHLIPSNKLWEYTGDEVAIIMTGSQGETDSALVRAANRMHDRVFITANDCIILSSRPIPGNEERVNEMIDKLESLNATVITKDVHVSGHACAEEIKLIYSTTKPKHIIPVHGEKKHLEAQRNIAKAMGYPEYNICLAECGDMIHISDKEIKITDKVSANDIYISGGDK